MPEIKMPRKALEGEYTTPPQTPGMDITGPVPVKPPADTIPVEQLIQNQKALPGSTQQTRCAADSICADVNAAWTATATSCPSPPHHPRRLRRRRPPQRSRQRRRSGSESVNEVRSLRL